RASASRGSYYHVKIDGDALRIELKKISRPTAAGEHPPARQKGMGTGRGIPARCRVMTTWCWLPNRSRER
ncbi:MAG: hypothetical protein ACE5GE_02805, partial [Phycisphaerae bacterium]